MRSFHITWAPGPDWQPSRVWLVMTAASLASWTALVGPLGLIADARVTEVLDRAGLLPFYQSVERLDELSGIDYRTFWAGRKLCGIGQIDGVEPICAVDNDLILRAPLAWDEGMAVQGLHWDPIWHPMYSRLDKELQSLTYGEFPVGVPPINCSVVRINDPEVRGEWLDRAFRFMRDYRGGDRYAMVFAEQKLLPAAAAWHCKRFGVLESIPSRETFLTDPARVMHIGYLKEQYEQDRASGDGLIAQLLRDTEQHNPQIKEVLCRAD